MNKFDNLVGLLGITVGLVGVGYALGTHTKMARISEKLDCAIEDLADKTPVDIPNNMIERAVEKAVALEVKQAVSKATDQVMVDIKRDIHKQISDAVESEYSSVKDAVLEELVTEASKIDAKRVRADVEKAAKAHALEKFDDELDDIAEEFKEKFDEYLDDCKDNLAVVNKVYKSFADAMNPSGNKEMVLRLG